MCKFVVDWISLYKNKNSTYLKTTVINFVEIMCTINIINCLAILIDEIIRNMFQLNVEVSLKKLGTIKKYYDADRLVIASDDENHKDSKYLIVI